MWYYGHPEVKTYAGSLIAIDEKHEKYIKKIVVKKTDDAEKYIMDVYISIYPRQFMKLDELFIKDSI